MNLYRHAALCLLLIPSLATLSAEPDRPGIYGAGRASCGVWLAERGKSDHGQSELMISWVLGFMTAMEADGTTHASTDKPAVVAFLDMYCKEHPLEQFAVAAATLSISLINKHTGEMNREIERLSGKKQ